MKDYPSGRIKLHLLDWNPLQFQGDIDTFGGRSHRQQLQIGSHLLWLRADTKEVTHRLFPASDGSASWPLQDSAKKGAAIETYDDSATHADKRKTRPSTRL